MDYIIEYDPEVKLADLYCDHFEVGQNLITHDGRVGNAIILKNHGKGKYTVMTDFGNIITLTFREIEAIFNLDITCLHVVDLQGRIDKQIELLETAKKRVQEDVWTY